MPEPVAAPRTTYRPVVLMHGLGDAGSNPGMQSLAQSVMAKYPGSYAVAVNVANGLDSFITPVQDQVDQFAKTVKADPKLANGFNVVGLSQGGLIVRAYVQQYNDPPVYNLVSICGVQNGVFNCPLEVQIIPFVCSLFETNPYHFFDFVGIHLSFEDYFKDPANETAYLLGNDFLPLVNNEGATKNPLYKSRMTTLNKLALIEATEDTVVYPYESEQFGGYVWGTKDQVFNFNTSDTYQQDWIGLRTLDAQGKVDLGSFVGGHIQFTQAYWNAVILPYFDN